MRPHSNLKLCTWAIAIACGVLIVGCHTPQFGFNDQVTNPMRITGFNVPSTGSIGIPVPLTVAYLGKESVPRLIVSAPTRDEISSGQAARGPFGELYVNVSVATISIGTPLPVDAFREPGVISGSFTPPATGTFLFIQRSLTPDYQGASASIEILP